VTTIGVRAVARFGHLRWAWRVRVSPMNLRLRTRGRVFAVRYSAVDSARDVSAARFLRAKTLAPDGS
jgi:hypothetical protein